jgi:hypothetical protein
MDLYDENGQVLKFSKFEIETAKERIKIKRSIRKKTFSLIPIKNWSTEKLIALDNLM